MFKKIFGVLQKVGRALMLPVAILPAAGILLALGTALTNPTLVDNAPFLDTLWVIHIADVMKGAGGIVFDNLPLLFAVGVAIGLAGGEGVAGLAAIVGYLIMNKTMGVIKGLEFATESSANANPANALVLGIPTLQTGVFGGIIVGILAAYMYNKFYEIELPSYLGFFSGKRFVPIVTAASAVVLGLVMIVIWPPVQHGLNSFSNYMLGSQQTLASFVFGVIERSLIPFGLHHIFYAPFWYEFGSYTTKAGAVVHGDQTIFMKQIQDGVQYLTAGTFQVGKYPFMMFGLPAAALAIYHEARPERKKFVAGIMGSAALTSFLTGITEPIEFSFLFVAPVLFGIHAIFAGLSFMVMHLLNVKIGMTFSGGLIDFVLFGVLNKQTHWWWVIPVGFVFAFIYYFGFRFAIRKFNLKTPGREDVEEDEEETAYVTLSSDLPYKILEAMGGKDNITNLDACITRLRAQVNNVKNVNKGSLKKLGATGVLEVGNNIQAIFGPKSETLKSQMKDIISGKRPRDVEVRTRKEAQPNDMQTNIKKTSNKDIIVAPATGELKPITDVPDPLFARKMMGDGFAIIPSEGTIVSPVNGKIINLFPTKHAIGIISDTGREILIHVGVDTVNLKGEGFQILVHEGEQVDAGQPLMQVDLELLKEKIPSIISPIIFTNLKEGEQIVLTKEGPVKIKERDIILIE